MINFPYYVDEVDQDRPDPNVWEPIGIGQRGGHHRLPPADRPAAAPHAADIWRRLVRATARSSSSAMTSVDWLGVPLRVRGKDGRRHRRPELPRGGSATPRRQGAPRRSSASHIASALERTRADRRDAPAQRRARAHQRRPARPRDEPRHAGDVRPRGRPAPGRSSTPRSSTSASWTRRRVSSASRTRSRRASASRTSRSPVIGFRKWVLETPGVAAVRDHDAGAPRRVRTARSDPGRAREVVRLRPARRRGAGRPASSRSRTSTASTRSTTRTSGSSRPSRGA